MSYSTEQLETIKNVMNERLKVLTIRISNFKKQHNLTDLQRANNIRKSEEEFAQVAFIEAIALREINNTIKP